MPDNTMKYVVMEVKPQKEYDMVISLIEENQENIKYFVEKLDSIKVIKELQILPTGYNDGFYYCLLEKLE